MSAVRTKLPIARSSRVTMSARRAQCDRHLHNGHKQSSTCFSLIREHSCNPGPPSYGQKCLSAPPESKQSGDNVCTLYISDGLQKRPYAWEASLRRLKTDHIDLYQMHHVDRSTPCKATPPAAADLGKPYMKNCVSPRYWLRWPDFCTIMQRCSSPLPAAAFYCLLG